MEDKSLYHHGILGMHWGVRRYENADGSLTEKGKKKVSAEYKKQMIAGNNELSKKYTGLYVKAYNKSANYMKESAIQHGITDIDFLFPDAQNATNTPGFISRDTGWVSKVMGGTHHTPFSRIKSMFADITEADARAKGYIKGNLKKDEVFSLLKRTTTKTQSATLKWLK